MDRFFTTSKAILRQIVVSKYLRFYSN